nr:MerR family DNA-binding protein [uncultured Brevundimonas sp.]
MNLTIAGLARAGGVGVETVRYYQRRDLMPKPDGDGGVRRYGEAEVRRLRFIRAAQGAGFTLEQIGELLALDAGHDHARARALAQARIADLDAKIATLQAARASLQTLSKRCGDARTGACPILTAFEGTI